MACHLDGGSCPHDWGMGRGGDYLTSGSSSYGRMSSYAAVPNYTSKNVALGSYAGSSSNAGYAPLQNPVALASYAANPKYDAAYKGAGTYVGQIAEEKKNQQAKPQKAGKSFSAYKNQQAQEKDSERTEQQCITSDVARPTPTIDDTLDSQNAIAVQRNFLEQMIQNARAQTVANQQPQYRLMYQ